MSAFRIRYGKVWMGFGALSLMMLGYWWGRHSVASQQTAAPLLAEAPLSDVIQRSTGMRVIPYEAASPLHQQVISLLTPVLHDAVLHFNAETSPVHRARRINEVSRYFEDYLQAQLDAHPDLACAIPQNAEGNPQRSGYPDLHLTHLPSGLNLYLDPKLYEQTARASTLRTFYYSPHSTRQKIHHDALHLLVGISHDGKAKHPERWTFLDWSLIDLSGLPLTLKSEYNASNRTIYQTEHQIEAIDR